MSSKFFPAQYHRKCHECKTVPWLILHLLVPLIRLLRTANEEVVAFQNALREFVSSVDTSYSKEFEEFFVGFEGR